MNNGEERTSESHQIELFNHQKEALEFDIQGMANSICDYEEVITKKRKEIDMLDYLTAKLNERIEEKEEMK